MSWFADLFKSKEKRESEMLALQARIAAEVRAQIESERKAREEEEDRQRRLIEAQILAEKMESTTPWYEPILGAEHAPLVNQRYRWNQAFIKDLIRKGYKGNSDNEIFEAFLERQEEESRKALIEEERNKKRNSPEPWVEVTSEKITEDGRVELELDWNAAFVKYLRKHGFRGATDEAIVHAWFAALEYDMTGEEFH